MEVKQIHLLTERGDEMVHGSSSFQRRCREKATGGDEEKKENVSIVIMIIEDDQSLFVTRSCKKDATMLYCCRGTVPAVSKSPPIRFPSST